MRESIFVSAIRSFFVALFAMIAISIGLIPLFIISAAVISALSSSTTNMEEPDSRYSQEIVANADGVRKVLSKNTPVILKLNIDGIIGTDSLSMEAIRRQLIESREKELKHDRVKGILLYVNSPGGTVIDSDGIYRAIKAYKEKYKVPVYTYVDGLCASGGFYISCAADKIYASDVSLIGSVGVLSPTFLNFTKLINFIGVDALTISAGKDKDLMNPLRPWRPEEPKIVQDLIDFFYQDFVNIVTTNRPEVSKEKLINEYGANIFNAPQAQEYGFINASGYTYEKTLKELVDQLGLKEDNYQVIQLQKKTWFSELFSTELPLLSGVVKHRIELAPELDPNLMNKFLFLYRPE